MTKVRYSNLMELITFDEQAKSTLIDLVSQGYTEKAALTKLQLPYSAYIAEIIRSPDFLIRIEDARKLRAEVWVEKIVESLEETRRLDDKEVAAERLYLDKLKFLASADNPERYGSRSYSKTNVNIDISTFKLLPPEEAIKSLRSDPFAKQDIEIVATHVKDSEEDLL